MPLGFFVVMVWRYEATCKTGYVKQEFKRISRLKYFISESIWF